MQPRTRARFRGRLALTAGVAVAMLVVASLLGVAAAEGPTTTPARTIAVEGVATAPISDVASAAEAVASYRQAMGSAVTDAQAKGEFLAGKVGATLGAAQSVVEEGGDITCLGLGEYSYATYYGAQPDFGSAPELGVRSGAAVSAPAAAPTTRLAPNLRKPALKKRRPRAKKAALLVTCTLEADVAVTYAMS